MTCRHEGETSDDHSNGLPERELWIPIGYDRFCAMMPRRPRRFTPDAVQDH